VSLLTTKDLTMHFPLHTGFFGRHHGVIKAVDGVNLSIGAGRTLGLVGESGCGKTTLGRCIVRAYEPTSGSIMYDGTDLATLPERELKPYRAQVRLIFQDPHSSLDPRKTLRDTIAEPLRVQQAGSRDEIDDKVASLLRRVGLRAEYANRYPHAFSGGERQRVVIARALATNPRLVVADEAVSALDVSVRAQILNLLVELRDRLGLAYLFVSHDLGVIRFVSHRVAVMYLGTLVEVASTAALFKQPLHPYTQALLAAIPTIGDGRTSIFDEARLLEGELPSPIDLPRGCRFAGRCPHRFARCDEAEPPLRAVAPGHVVACYLYDGGHP
jgi:oligopeptide/dipeptide ABC transporter ATP-binding protein